MKIYRRGPKSKASVDYVVVVTSESATWCFADENMKCVPHFSYTAPTQWVSEKKWTRVELPKYMRVALRICQPQDMYKLITSYRRSRMSIKNRGFASLDRTRQREIASKGGKAAHKLGTAHHWTSEEAREAGRKGGLATKAKAVRLVEVRSE